MNLLLVIYVFHEYYSKSGLRQPKKNLDIWLIYHNIDQWFTNIFDNLHVLINLHTYPKILNNVTLYSIPQIILQFKVRYIIHIHTDECRIATESVRFNPIK